MLHHFCDKAPSMTTPPQPVPGNPYAQPVAGNPYAKPGTPPQEHPYGPGPTGYPAPPQPYAGQPPVPPQQFAPQQQVPPQQQFAPQQPFAPQDQQFQQFQQPQQPQSFDPTALCCRICGAQPAVDTTVRAHRGMVFVMQWRSLRGPFCRTCGIATVRRLSADTLWQGWWGYISSVMAPVTLIRNLLAYNKIKKLPPPIPGQPGQQLIPGRPLLQRPAALGFLVPVAVLAVIIGILALPSSSSATDTGTGSSGAGTNAAVGDCVQNTGTTDDPTLTVVTCGSGDFKVLAKLPETTSDSGCPSATTQTYTQTDETDPSDTANEFVLCLVTYTA